MDVVNMALHQQRVKLENQLVPLPTLQFHHTHEKISPYFAFKFSESSILLSKQSLCYPTDCYCLSPSSIAVFSSSWKK